MKTIDEDVCIGCGICVPNCTIDAIEIVDNRAEFVKDCIDCAFCLPEDNCPTSAISYLIRRRSDQ